MHETEKNGQRAFFQAMNIKVTMEEQKNAHPKQYLLDL